MTTMSWLGKGFLYGNCKVSIWASLNWGFVQR